MKNGTRPTTHLPRRRFHHYFGSVLNPTDAPDFNVDTGVNGMPDQERDNAPTECTGYTAADILSDICKRAFSPDFSYAAAFLLSGETPSLAGASFTAALDGAVGVGGLPTENADITAASKGELFVANWAAWSDADKKRARDFVQVNTYDVLGSADAFDSILSALLINKYGVSIGTPWFEEWTTNIQGGVVQMPKLDGQYPSWHNYAAKGKKTINGVPYLIIKSWQGTRVGDGGYLYFSRETVNAALSIPLTGAITLATTGNRWVAILAILLKRFPSLLTFLPQLLKAYV